MILTLIKLVEEYYIGKWHIFISIYNSIVENECRFAGFFVKFFDSIWFSFDLQKHFCFLLPLIFFFLVDKSKINKKHLANHQINFLVIFLFSSLFHFHRCDLVKNKSNTKWIGHTHIYKNQPIQIHWFGTQKPKIERNKTNIEPNVTYSYSEKEKKKFSNRLISTHTHIRAQQRYVN